MKRFLEVFKKARLFSGLSEREILSALDCLSSTLQKFNKNDVIFCEGETAEFVGVLLSGEIRTQKTDYNGNVNIISKLYPAEIIAASACYSEEKRLPFDVLCASECEVLRMDSIRLIRPCHSACPFHARLIQNMLGIIADRNTQLAAKIDILTKRTIKEKVLAYLYSQSKRAKNNSFSIPLSRRQMAEYLSINRSALSRELCNLRDEGVLEFDGSHFKLK